jgi:hypothetical protein
MDSFVFVLVTLCVQLHVWYELGMEQRELATYSLMPQKYSSNICQALAEERRARFAMIVALGTIRKNKCRI